MDAAEIEDHGLDYRICRYGQSRAAFRGPEKSLEVGYVAVVGGSECFGKFVTNPFPDLMELALGERVINLGVMHAGLTLIAGDPAILPIASGARMTVVQVLGALNMSNRYYSVHPRRNDRFVAASPRLQRLYPEIDFTDFNFTGHLVTTLEEADEERFAIVREELQTAWVSRMRTVLNAIPGESVLLWMSERSPDDGGNTSRGIEPLMVNRAMLEDLSPNIAGIIEVRPNEAARSEGLQGKVYCDEEEQAAAAMPGPIFHAQTASALARVIAQPGALPDVAKSMGRSALG